MKTRVCNLTNDDFFETLCDECLYRAVLAYLRRSMHTELHDLANQIILRLNAPCSKEMCDERCFED